MQNLTGVIVATVTPIKEGHVHKDGFVQLVDFLTEKRVQAIFVCGTTGEGMIMSLESRKRAAEIVRERSKIPVIVHAGTNVAEDTQHLASHANQIGAEAIAVITPMFYPYTNEGLGDYFQTIARHCDIPLFIYSNPGRAGTKMTPEGIAKAASASMGRIVGVKESSGDMGYLGKIIQTNPELTIFNGADNCFLPGLVLGTTGQVSGYATLTPELYVSLFDCWKNRKIEEAMKLQQKISKIKALLEVPYIQPIKEGLKMRGIDAGDVIAPLVRMKQEEISKLEEKLSEFAPELFQ